MKYIFDVRRFLSVFVVFSSVFFASIDANAAMQRREDVLFRVNAAGNVLTLPGATVTVYSAGTTSLVPIYSDQGITPIANSRVTAGSDGTYFYYAADGTYDEYIQKAGYTSYTRSGVHLSMGGPWTLSSDYTSSLVTAASVAAQQGQKLICASHYSISSGMTITVPFEAISGCTLSQTATSATVTFSPPGTFTAPTATVFSGATTTFISFGVGSVKEVYPEWWGAKGDATSAFNSAISTGLPISLLSGTYSLTSLGTISTDVVIKGKGKGTILLFNTSGTGISLGRVAYKKAHLSDFSLKSITNTPESFIDNSMDGTLLENLFFDSTSATAGIRNLSAYGLTIRKSEWGFFTGTPIVLQQSPSDAPYYSYNVTIDNIDISNNTGSGLQIYGGGAISVENSVIESCSDGGIISNTTNSTPLLGFELRNDYFEGNSSSDISVTDSGTYWSEITCFGCRFVVPAGIDIGQKSKISIIRSFALSGTQTITGSVVAQATLCDVDGTWSKSGTFYWLDIGSQKYNTSEPIIYDPEWTASPTPPIISNGTITAQYTRIGNTITTNIYIVSGSTTSFGSGQWLLHLPYAPLYSGQIGTVVYADVSSGFKHGFVYGNAGTTSIYLYSAETAAYAGSVSATVPFTWANGDWMALTMTYVAEGP